jgi:antitoxin Phd
MKIDTKNIVSLSEANRNFSRVARLADDSGAVVIMRNNAPSYLLTTFSQAENEQAEPNEDVMDVARRLTKESKNALTQEHENKNGGDGA